MVLNAFGFDYNTTGVATQAGYVHFLEPSQENFFSNVNKCQNIKILPSEKMINFSCSIIKVKIILSFF